MERIFEVCGKIRSLKVSLNSDHSSRGYGFICFEEEESVQRALEIKLTDKGQLKKGEDETHVLQVARFEPRDGKHQLLRLINNVYVKNIPSSTTEQELRKLFEPYGSIKSIAIRTNSIGTFGFVCYDDPKGVNKEYGPQCAQKAIDALNGFEMGGSIASTESSDGSLSNKLVVRHALKSSQRLVEKLRESINYKASKRKCNLYVKGFPVQWSKEQLIDLFNQFGSVENVRLEKGQQQQNGELNPFAFVCFKDPNEAAKAK